MGLTELQETVSKIWILWYDKCQSQLYRDEGLYLLHCWKMPMEALPQLRKSGGDIIASYKSINVPKTFSKEEELCSTGAENKWLSVTLVSEHFKQSLKALSCFPWHGFGELLIQCIVPTAAGHCSCCGPRKPMFESQSKYSGTQKVHRAAPPGLQTSHINLPISSKMAHMRAPPFHKALITTLACLPTVF